MVNNHVSKSWDDPAFITSRGPPGTSQLSQFFNLSQLSHVFSRTCRRAAFLRKKPTKFDPPKWNFLTGWGGVKIERGGHSGLQNGK